LSSAVGSLTVSNCVVSEYRDDSANFSFNFVTTTTIPVTVQTSPSGLTFTVDGTAYTSPQTFNWTTNSTHTIATTTPQTGGSAQYSWSSWSDGGAISHTVSPAVATTYTANFTATQYYLTMNAGTGGSVSPVSGWYNAGTNLNISATPSGGFTFSGWTGSGTGSYSGANNPASISMNGPITETANFNGGIFVTVQTSPAGRTFSVDGTSYSSPQVFNWAPYASHTIATTTPQSGGAGTQYVWSSWSDGGALLHYVAPATDTTYTANFTTQYYLTMNAGSGGSVSPASGWQNSGASVGITATASNGFAFSSWTGTGSGSYSGGANPSSVTMNAAISQTATFLVSSEQVQSLSFVQQPGNVNQGATITPSVQVQAIGTNSLPLAGVPINLSLGSGTGTLGGTLARTTDAGGVATFNDLNVNLAGPKILTATLGGKSTNSILFNVIGPAVGLAFTTQPGSAIAGQPFGQPPVVRTVDAFGTPSTVGLPASLMVSVALTNGAGTLSGTTTLDIGASAGNGVATFSNLSIDAAGAGNQLLASTGSTPITNPVSGAKIWLDASATASVLTNTSGIVTNWLDLSGNNNHFNQTIGSGAGIVYTNTVANGRKTVTFQAATELKNATYSNTNKTISVFLVAKKTVAGIADGQYQAVFGTWAAGATADYTDPGSFSLNYNISNTTPRVLRACCTTYVDNNCPAMDPAAGYHVFQYVANGVGSNDIWLTSISGTTQGNGPRLDSVSANFNIVASTVGGGLLTNDTTTKRPFAGSIAEVLVYNTALSTTERTSVTSYLTNKWLAAAAGYGLTSATSAPFDVQPLTITVTVQTSPAGHSFAVDGVVYSSAQTFNWIPGANHTVATTSPQNIGSGEWVWASWSDSGAISHTVAPVSSTSYTANFSFVVSLLGITTVSNGLVGLSYATASGLTYHVETTTNLTPAVWTPIPGSTTNADGNIIIFVDPNASADPQRFYRIRSP
jgi:hypothetical protein